MQSVLGTKTANKFESDEVSEGEASGPMPLGRLYASVVKSLAGDPAN